MKTVNELLALMVLSLGTLFFFAPTPAFACSCAVDDWNNSAERADVVVKGVFVEPINSFDGNLGNNNVPTPFNVEWVYKGKVPLEIDVEVGASESTCGWTPEAGRYLMFLKENERGTYGTSLCASNLKWDAELETEISGELGVGYSPSDVAVPDDEPLTEDERAKITAEQDKKKADEVATKADNDGGQTVAIVVVGGFVLALGLLAFGAYKLIQGNRDDSDLP